MNKIDISIIILTRNPGKNFNDILEKIFSQKTFRSYEVLIIDSESHEEFNKILIKFPIRFIRIKAINFNHGTTRNYAAGLTDGNLLVYLTQDALPANVHWLENLVKNLDHDNTIAGAYSKQIPFRGCNPILAHEIATRFGDTKEIIDPNSLNNKKRDSPPYVKFSDVSSCIRRSVLEKIRFRDGIILGEDVEWAKRTLQAGYKIVYAQDSIVYHSHNYSLISSYIFNFNFLCGFVYKQYALTKPKSLKGVFSLLPIKSVYHDIKFIKNIKMGTFKKMRVIGYSVVYHHIKRFSQFLGYHINYYPIFIVKKFYNQKREK